MQRGDTKNPNDGSGGTKISPDFTFERDGVSLEQCLLDLVNEDRAVRTRAGERLQAMAFGLPTSQGDTIDIDHEAFAAGVEQQGTRFKAAIRAAVAADGFETADFIRRLCALELAMNADWQRRCAISSDRSKQTDIKFDRLAGQLKHELESAPDEAARLEAKERIARVVQTYICSSFSTTDDPLEGAESMSASAIAANQVLEALGADVMAAPDAIEALLHEPQLRYQGLKLITNAGSAARAFVPFLLGAIESLTDDRSDNDWASYEAATPLAAIAAGDAETIDHLVKLLDHPSNKAHYAAAVTLREMNGDLCGRNVRITQKLMQPRGNIDAWEPPHTSLASVGHSDPAVRAFIASHMRARPPEMITLPYGDLHDAAMSDRGHAIDATRYLTSYPDEFVPLLIEALDNFEEYNPDEEYSGPCGRISCALQRFGPAAGAAAVPLARRLTPESDETPRAILDALAAIGPAARDALPLLQAYRQTTETPQCPLPDLHAGPADPTDDPSGVAIQKILGI